MLDSLNMNCLGTLQSGHLNITDGQAKVEIKDGKALIPSLQTHDDFFYTLNLNPSHYKSKLPFIFESTYKQMTTKPNYQTYKCYG